MAIQDGWATARQHVEAAHQRLGRWAWPTWLTSAAVTVIAITLVVVGPGPGGIRAAADMPVSTLVYDMHDQPVFNIFREHRTTVALADMSPHVIRAVLAVEDERFYSHGGIDVRRIIGAAMANFKQGELAEGGSTITQQLARKAFLTDRKSFRRKAREAVLAVRLEWAFSKDAILEMYLNRIYFGRGFYGIEAAALGYFGKPASALTLDEAALLVGLIPAPSAYAPPTHLARALARRTVVLGRMTAVGAITADDAARANAAEVTLRRELEQPQFGAYFRNRVLQELVDRFGEDLVWSGGLRVFTTVDPVLQRAAEHTLATGLTTIETRRGFTGVTRAAYTQAPEGRPSYLQGAFVAIDPRNGQVRALVGGRDFEDSMFDRAVDAQRQAGSAYKPFVFAAALESGAGPATLLTDLNATTQTASGDWRPNVSSSDGATVMTMRRAMRVSNNRAAVRVLHNVGIPRAVNYATQLGLAAPPAVPSMVLGSGEVSLLTMTNAYTAFANGGTLHAPSFIRRVEDRDGNLLWQHAHASRQAVSPSTAFLMADMLADVINRGTGHRVRTEGFTLPAGGKTGTTNDYKDAWFIGFTPSLVAGVWAGFDEPRTIVPGGYATGLVVPIWARFMKEATKGHDDDWVPRPPDVITVRVCLRSGLKPTGGCQLATVTPNGNLIENIGQDFFRAGTEPEEYCPLHGQRGFLEELGIRKAVCVVVGC